VYRAPATDPGGSCTGSHYDWLAWHGTGLQATGPAGYMPPLSGNSKWRWHLRD